MSEGGEGAVSSRQETDGERRISRLSWQVIVDQVHLVDHDAGVEAGGGSNEVLDALDFTQQAQRNDGDGDDGEFPDPEFVTVRCYGRTGDGVQFPSAAVQDDAGKDCIHDIEHDDQDKQDEQLRAVAVDKPTLELVLPAAEVPSLTRDRVTAQPRCRFLAAVLSFSSVFESKSHRHPQTAVLNSKNHALCNKEKV